MPLRRRLTALTGWTMAFVAVAWISVATLPADDPYASSNGSIQVALAVYAACWAVGLVAAVAGRRHLLAAAGWTAAMTVVLQLTGNRVQLTPMKLQMGYTGPSGYLWLLAFVLLWLGLLFIGALALDERRRKAGERAAGVTCPACGANGLRRRERCPICGAIAGA